MHEELDETRLNHAFWSINNARVWLKEQDIEVIKYAHEYFNDPETRSFFIDEERGCVNGLYQFRIPDSKSYFMIYTMHAYDFLLEEMDKILVDEFIKEVSESTTKG